MNCACGHLTLVLVPPRARAQSRVSPGDQSLRVKMKPHINERDGDEIMRFPNENRIISSPSLSINDLLLRLMNRPVVGP